MKYVNQHVCRLCVIAAVCLGFSVSLEANEAKAGEAKLESKPNVNGLIKNLGASSFATREKAQSELEQLGLKAFDALFEAQYNNDIEIAMRARIR
ncbi:MAG: hypothetical protein IH991_17970 [Planctomycetes bacterium]|nr:hypothetical protein [Planctomycetota bacterium]